MTTTFPMRAACLFTLILACIGAGCSTPGASDLAAGTARRMSETSKTCDTLSNQIGQTTGALQSVVSNARADPREAYVTYSHNLGALTKLVEEARANHETLGKDGNTYFAQWEKSNRTIGDETLRKKADQRKNDVHDEFTRTTKQLDSALEDLGPFVSQLEDVRAYLSSDLSSAGIESLRGRVGDLGAKGRGIQKKLAGVNESVQKILPDLGARMNEPTREEKGAVH
jgi:ABC-type transporter Mla subunit MlaD